MASTFSLLTKHAVQPARSALHYSRRTLATSSDVKSASSPKTHYRITLQRSAISLPKHMKATLVSLGIHRRLQTVFHPHSPINAGKILRVKELVSVQNVTADEVRTKTEMRRERKAPRGYVKTGNKLADSL
ncbi:hypothetical protein K474DRAFT_1608664 [Panus rudis PR-1116 ss-1]|nr:hypothetical protein K474DRAFT_1608664 [Panus rudis PR-1116 ss-1]